METMIKGAAEGGRDRGTLAKTSEKPLIRVAYSKNNSTSPARKSPSIVSGEPTTMRCALG